MKFSTVFATFATVVLGVQALPQPLARSNNSQSAASGDETLSFLVVAVDYKTVFYQTLSNYTQEDFTNAGYSAQVWENFTQIAQAGAQWKNNITEAVGNDAVSPYSYRFKHHDPRSFVRESVFVEAISVTAYSSVYAQSSNQDYYNTVCEILEAELEIVSWLLSYFDGTSWDGYFNATLSIEQAATLIAPYASNSSSSSSSSPSLYGTSVPLSYTVTGNNTNTSVDNNTKSSVHHHTKSTPYPGAWLLLNYDYTPANDEEIFAVFITAEAEYYVTVNNGQVQIPAEIDVAVALVVISTSSSSINQEDVVTAFALVVIEEVSTTGNNTA